jgi:hypothetical protein
MWKTSIPSDLGDDTKHSVPYNETSTQVRDANNLDTTNPSNSIFKGY